MKTIRLVLMSLSGALLVASTAYATPPCEPGTNGSGTCSWTCSQNVYNVTCTNPDGPDRCYVRDENNNTTRAARCSNFEPYGSPVNFNPFLQTTDEGGHTIDGGRTRGGDGTSTPTLAPAETRTR